MAAISTRAGLITVLLVGGALAAPAAGSGDGPLNADTDPPTFGAPLPAESEWITSVPAFLAVQIFDNGSGVDPARIEYSTEYDGAPFVHWFPAEITQGSAAGEVVAHATVNLPEGSLSNIIWRAWDKAGNGPAESRIFGLNVDTQEITFYDPHPDPAAWVDNANVTPHIWIRAGTSALNGSALEYRISNNGLSGFGPWTTWCPPRPPLPPGEPARLCLVLVRRDANGSIDLSAGRGYHIRNMTYAQGDGNWVQWRASNDTSGRVYVSDPYNIRYDSLAPVIAFVLPNGSQAMPLAPVELLVEAHEGSPPEVPQRGLNLSAGAARYRVLSPGAWDFGPWLALAVLNATEDGWSAQFAANFTPERGNSTVEVEIAETDGSHSTARTTIWINRAPEVELHSEPAGFMVRVNGTLVVTASVDDDTGGPFEYNWSTCDAAALPVSTHATVSVSLDGADELRTDRERNIVLCLTVRDGLDGVTVRAVTVHVLEVLPDPPDNAGPGSRPPPLAIGAGLDLLWLLLIIAAGGAATFVALRNQRRPPHNP